MSESSSRDIVIVRPADSSFQEEHAACELQKYAEALTRAKPAIVTDAQFKAGASGTYFLIGPPERNRAADEAVKHGMFSLAAKLPAHPDGFVAQSDQKNGASMVLLAGRRPIGSLYAVYDYLETYCGVGFFQDGENVPHLSRLPTAEIARVEQPRFDERLHLAWNAHRCLKKYHSYWWTAEEWKRELDWMVKRRMNMVRVDMGYYSNFAGDSFLQAFPEIGPEKEERVYPHLAGWSVEWGWPPAYKRQQTREMFDYGRKLGIRFLYGMDYGTVPFRFKDKFPQYKYMPGDQYGESRQISPYDPMAREVTKKYLAKIIELLGTDHLYMFSPYAEIDVGQGDAEKNLDMRIEAARGIIQLIEEVDKQGHWVTDTWDVADSPGRWNPQRMQKYMDSFPDDKMYLYETAADVNPVFKTFDYWHRKKWAFGVINTFAGKEVLHGNIQQYMERLSEAAACPTCTGLFMVPELTHANIMFWDLTTHLAWQPTGVDFQAYLKDYVLRRYGSEFQAPMLEAWNKVVQAVYSTRSSDVFAQVYRFNPWHQWKPGGGNCPLFSDTEPQLKSQLAEVTRELPLLEDALATLLKYRAQLKGNSLYVEDLVVLYRTCAGKRFDQVAGAAYEAFKAGDKAALERHRTEAMAILDSFVDVLALCPSYSINKTIEETASVPGTNSLLAETIRQNCINQRYTTNDVYEQFEGDYIPRTKAYFDLLAAKMQKGEKTVAFAELDEPFKKIDENYRMHGWSGKPETGDPVARVEKNFRSLLSAAK